MMKKKKNQDILTFQMLSEVECEYIFYLILPIVL